MPMRTSSYLRYMSEHNKQPFTVEGTLKLDAAAAAAQAGTAPPPGSGRGATILVAASNSNSAGHAAADYVCTGTSTTGGDEVTINAAIVAAQGGRVVLLEGVYWRTNPIVCDDDFTVLEGQGSGTVIAVPTSGVSPSGYASIIFGNTRTLTQAAIRHLRVQPEGPGTDLVSGSGHGIAFRCNNGRLDDVIVQSCSGDGWKIGGCTDTSQRVTITQPIDAPAQFTEDTWSVSAVPDVPLPAWAKVTTSAYNGTPGNDDGIETVVITASGPDSVTVVRGWDGTPISAIPAGAQLIPINRIYEVGATMLHSIFPGGCGMTIEPTSENCEFIRCVVNGGMNLDTPRGTYGFRAYGNIIKFLLCHAYYNQNDGLTVNLTGLENIGSGQVQVIGGEYETNGENGISLYYAYYGQVTDAVFYANYNQSVLLHACDRTTLTGLASQYIAGAASPEFQHIYANSSSRTRITGSRFELGDATAIIINGYSPGTVVQDNTIFGLDPSEPGANAVRLAGCSGVSVIGNTVDRPILEDTTPGGDFNGIWGNRILNTNNAVGAALAGVTTNGAHTVAYENLGQSDKVYNVDSVFTAVLRKTHLVSAPSGGTTVILPGAGYFGASTNVGLDSGSQGVELPQGTLTLSGAPADVPIGGQVMVPVTGGRWSFVTYSSIDGAVLSGCAGGSGTTTAGNVYLLPPDGEEFSIVQVNDSDTVILQAPPGSLINGASSFTLAPRRAYRAMLSSGNWNVY